jgi:hypothetical protein
VHGLELEVAGSLPSSLLAELLGGFPAGDSARAPDLVIQLEPAVGPPPDGRPLFFHGRVRVRAVDGALVVTDGHSAARVADGGGRIELAVSPVSLEEDRRGFEHVLALIALVLALRYHRLYHLHAAVLVRGDGRSVLVAGEGGAGKSTLCLALLEYGGLDYLGDDAVFLAPAGGGVAVRALPRLFHVGEVTARAFPRIAALLAADQSEGKRSLDPRRAFPGRERAEAGAPCVVILPRVDGEGRTQVRELAPVDALGALIGSSTLVAIEGLPGAREHLALLGRAVERAQCVEVTLGGDFLEAPAGCVEALRGVLLRGQIR